MVLPASRIFVIVWVILAAIFCVGWFLVYRFLKRLRNFLMECKNTSDEEDKQECIYQVPIVLVQAVSAMKQDTTIPVLKIMKPVPTTQDTY